MELKLDQEKLNSLRDSPSLTSVYDGEITKRKNLNDLMKKLSSYGVKHIAKVLASNTAVQRGGSVGLTFSHWMK
jgi:hypothetical protein